MITKIKRQDCLGKFKIFPLLRDDNNVDKEAFFYPKVYKSHILTITSKSFKGHARTLGIELTKLTGAFHIDTLIFLGDSEIPWLYQHNDYKPAREAQEYLIEKMVGRRFNGALQVNISELPLFIKHLAWLTRCNASLSNFYFIDKQQRIVSNICKYGNLHLDTLNKQSENLLRTFVKKSNFKYGNKNSCHNWFSKTGAIYGRQTKV